jgi:hypothetical protein
MKSTFLLIVPGLLLLVSCKDSGTQPPADISFAIYTMRDTTIESRVASNLPLEDLALAQTPIIRGKDLRAYYWATHTFVPVPSLDTLLKQMARQGGRTRGVPFVVTVGRQRIYLGTFWWAYSSSLPTVPSIELITSGPYTIAPAAMSTGTDRRQDPRIRESLRAAGVLVD